MNEFIIRQISNGWVLQGPRHEEDLGTAGIQAELFLATIHAVADILTTWQAMGFIKAAIRAEEKYGGKNA